MANYEKYDGKAGGHRAVLEEDWKVEDLKKVIGVGFNASGNLVVGEGTTGLVGVLVLTEAWKAGDTVDPMQHGEIVDFMPSTPGTKYYADPVTGVVNATAGAGKHFVGYTGKAGHLFVRFDHTPLAA